MQSSQNMSCVLCKCTKLLLKYTNNFKCIDISSKSIDCFTPWIKCSKNIQQKLLYIPFYTKEQHFFHWYMYKKQVFLWNCIIRKCLLLPSSFNFEPKINEKKNGTSAQTLYFISVILCAYMCYAWEPSNLDYDNVQCVCANLNGTNIFHQFFLTDHPNFILRLDLISLRVVRIRDYSWIVF